jgi:hypothetical protein
MKFASTYQINKKSIETATRKFNLLLLELGTRKENTFVGSGLGGDNFKLLVLMCHKHYLIDDSISGIVLGVEPNNIISWGVDHLINSDMRTIREDLDTFFPVITEKHKYLALSLMSLPNNDQFAKVIADHIASFPKIGQTIKDGKYKQLHSLNMYEQLMVAYMLCNQLASELDQGIKKNVQSVARALDHFNDEVILLSVRLFIGIERLVHHDLDEDEVFYPVLNRINKVVTEIKG